MPSRYCVTVSRQQRLQRLGDVLRGEPERAGAILVDLEPDRLDLLAPIEMRVDDLGVPRHHLAHLLGDRAHLRVGPDHAELHRKPTGGPNTKRSTRRAPRATRRRQSPLEPRLDARAPQVLGDDDDLREVRVRQHRIEPEPEARRALAHIAGVGDDVRVAGEQLSAFALASVTPMAVPSGSRISKNSSSGRGREELLLHQAGAPWRTSRPWRRPRSCARRGTGRSRGAAPIDAGVVDRVRIPCARRAWRDRAGASARDRA